MPEALRRLARSAFPIVLVAGCLAPLPALAQDAGRRAPPARFYEMRFRQPAPRHGKGPITPLPPAAQERLDRGRAALAGGSTEAAREEYQSALALAPNHPLVLVELARVHQTQGAWRALEQLARSARAATRDSLLLADDLVLALRRQGRERDAAQIVLEAWLSASTELDWASTMLDSLLPGDPKAIREMVRKAAAARPERPDLARGAAHMEWRLGDSAAALRLLAAADQVFGGAPVRWSFAEELLASASARDTAGALEVLLELAADRRREVRERTAAAQRAWMVYERRGAGREGAPRIARALTDLPGERWPGPLLIAVTRGLREAGLTAEARGLLKTVEGRERAVPDVALERVLNDLRDGPPERALDALRALAQDSPAARFRYAEALFFSGQHDSALVWYQRAADEPSSPHAGAALERIYLIEDARPREALVAFGRMAYEEWRREPRQALAIADSLYRSLDRGPLWAQSALALAALRESTGDGKTALEPLLAVAEGLPQDRLAPLARQRAGDVLRIWHKDEARALAQYEECLARYPKAWNAPEVRRMVETLRRERRF